MRDSIRKLCALVVLHAHICLANCASGQQLEFHQIYIRNVSDHPVRVYLIHAELAKSFCVMRVNEGGHALIEGVPAGHYLATVFELVKKDGWGSAGVRLNANSPGKTLEIKGVNDIVAR